MLVNAFRGRGRTAPAGFAGIVALVVTALVATALGCAPATAFRAGAAGVDITPPAGLPLWGYGGRKDLPAAGAHDPLRATCVVIEAGGARDGVRPRLDVVVLNDDIAIVSASGELFCGHALRLRESSPYRRTLFVGYANGYHQYFPTLAAVEEGGYGADPEVSPVAIGAGEAMIDFALETLDALRRGGAPAGSSGNPLAASATDP